MLWCSMMEVEITFSEQSDSTEKPSMDHHCDSNKEEESSNTELAHQKDTLDDCECLTIQSGLLGYMVPIVPSENPTITYYVFAKVVATLNGSTVETFPPPLWNSSSYSPSQLFLANAAFLI